MSRGPARQKVQSGGMARRTTRLMAFKCVVVRQYNHAGMFTVPSATYHVQW